MSCDNINCNYSTWTKSPCLNNDKLIKLRTINVSSQGTNSTGCDTNQNNYIDIETCIIPNNCELSNWSEWSPCSSGKQIKTRQIKNAPKIGGDECPKSLKAFFETQNCTANNTTTGICRYTNWSDWSPCSTIGGIGYQVRTRGIETVGGNCSNNYEDYVQKQNCNIGSSNDCILSDWSWSPCSTKCGSGFKIGTRTILENAKNNGKSCPMDINSYYIKQDCISNEYCPVGCTVTNWSTCNSDFVRTRNVTPAQNCGTCPQGTDTTQTCNYRYVGCYNDTGDRALTTYLGNIQNVNECYSLAKNKNLKFFGAQYNNQCFGGNVNYDSRNSSDESGCKYECSGIGGSGSVTSTPQCGTAWKNAVYEVNNNSNYSTIYNYDKLLLYIDMKYSYDSKTTLKDLSNKKNDLSANNCTFTDSDGGAIIFNGSTSYLYRSTFTDFNSNNFTCIVWVRLDVKNNNGVLFQLGRSPSDAQTEIVYYTNNLWDWQNSIGFANINPLITPSEIGWYQLCFVKNGTSGKYYLNGNENGSFTASLNATYSSNDFCIGKDYRDNISFLQGKIGIFLIYNYSMTGTEIKSNYDTYKSRYPSTNCAVTDWSACNGSKRTRTVTQATNGGTACTAEQNVAEQTCNHCSVGTWGACDGSKRTRTVTQATNGGTVCTAEQNVAEKTCNHCNVSRWSTCTDGTKATRTVTQATNGGTECTAAQNVTEKTCSGITVYEHVNYVGNSSFLEEGYYDIYNMGIANDNISSVKVPAYFKVTLYEHNNGGSTLVLTSDEPNLVNRGFNDVVSSIRVEKLPALSAPPVKGIAGGNGIATGDVNGCYDGCLWFYCRPENGHKPHRKSYKMGIRYIGQDTTTVYNNRVLHINSGYWGCSHVKFFFSTTYTNPPHTEIIIAEADVYKNNWKVVSTNIQFKEQNAYHTGYNS
jgi:hypothetical protein